MKRWSVIVFLTLGATVLAGLLFMWATPTASNRRNVVADFDAAVSSGPTAYGTNIWWTDQDAAMWTSRWAELKPSWVRLFISHSIVEPENDNANSHTIDWNGFRFDTPISVPVVMTRTMTYRDWFEALRDQSDVHILIHFVYLAPWLTDNAPHAEIPIPAAPYPPNDVVEYREFIEATARFLVEEIGFPPERIAFEVMNEPDLECGADPAVPCFWQNWTMDDIRTVVSVTHQVVEEVAPAIELVGLAECHGTTIVRDLLDSYPEGAYLDGLSYHYYAPGNDLNTALNRAAELSPYRRPIYLDEYGSLLYRSNGVDGALWHSLALATLWRSGIAPIQYPISTWSLLGEPYNSMGLFEDWRGGWAYKPSYWVHANFFRFLGGGEIISHTASAKLNVLVSRRFTAEKTQVVFWMVNREKLPLPNIAFALYNFPASRATLHIYDNLIGSTPLMTETIQGDPLIFTATLPARSSRAFVLNSKPLSASLDPVLPTHGQATLTMGYGWDVTQTSAYSTQSDVGGFWSNSRYTAEMMEMWMVTGTHQEQANPALLTAWQPPGRTAH